ncbi:MAG TPA: HD domain-containing phosphohydrolase [Solirubrobacterales bacterium]|nr:HD domain-containing phosphohydrolase [Solirubrobacterales bacterium]
MSSERPSDSPSRETEPGAPDEPRIGLAARVEALGAALLEGLERHLPGSREHAEGTGSYAFVTAVELGFDRDRAELVREAARLHEIGKVYLPAELLAKRREELSADERRQLDSHFARGAELARGAGVPEQVCEWIGAAGERFDGGTGHEGEEPTPVEARIVSVACACDALLSRPPVTDSPQDPQRIAVAHLRDAAGRELDPDVVEALAAMLERAAEGPRRSSAEPG